MERELTAHTFQLEANFFGLTATDLRNLAEKYKIKLLYNYYQIGAITSGVTTTCVCCTNAAGEFVPLTLIFTRVGIKKRSTN